MIDRYVRPDPGSARAWLRDELSRREYHRSLFERLRDWLDQRLGDALDAAGHATGFSTFAALLILAVVLIGALLLARHLRYEKRARTAPSTDTGIGATVTAAEHRGRAEAALAAGRFEEAVVEGLRAIAQQLVDRTILPDDPGTTAHELADGAARAFPDQAAGLAGVVTLFDGVQYGGRSADADEAGSVLRLDAELTAARPVRRDDALVVPR